MCSLKWFAGYVSLVEYWAFANSSKFILIKSYDQYDQTNKSSSKIAILCMVCGIRGPVSNQVSLRSCKMLLFSSKHSNVPGIAKAISEKKQRKSSKQPNTSNLSCDGIKML